MKRWEYVVLYVGKNPQRLLNDWGKSGWELVAVSEGRMFLKRELFD